MAFNGLGTFSLAPTSVAPAVSSTTISSTDFNATTADIVSGLNKALCRDGQANPTANLPMATYRHTGVGNAAAATDYAAAGQVQAGTMTYAATSVGTDAYAITVTPSISAYTAGMRFQALIDVANTGACTLNVNAVGAVAIKTQDGADPATNVILATSVIDVIHDGTNFVLLSPTGGSMAGVTLVSPTLTTPTLTSPVLNGTLSGTAIGRGALVYASGVQVVAHNTYTHLAFDTESYDTDGIHDNATNNGRLTVPAGVSVVKLTGFFRFATNGTGTRTGAIGTSDAGGTLIGGIGLPILHRTGLATGELGFNLTSSTVNVTPGDYFVLTALQTSGGNLNVSSDASYRAWFCMEIIK